MPSAKELLKGLRLFLFLLFFFFLFFFSLPFPSAQLWIVWGVVFMTWDYFCLMPSCSVH